MANRLETYHAIAQILDTSRPAKLLEPMLKQSDFDWDSLVVEGSKHLMLPALYCSLKTKNLLHCPPRELVSYLDELTSINRNRNKSILKQVRALSALFKAHKVNHVFLKGAAVLASGVYTDPGARMIGDIDILIEKEHLNQAFNLLRQHDYYPIQTTFGSNYVEHKHLPRLKTDTYIAAVELHRKVLDDFPFEPLNSSAILLTKEQHMEIAVPNVRHLYWHCILNQQINDDAYRLQTFHFKTGYEVHLLLHSFREHLHEKLTTDKVLRAYYRYHNYFFSTDAITNEVFSRWGRLSYQLRLKYIAYGNFFHRLAYSWSYFLIITKRFRFFLFKKAYRKSVWKDRKRIWYTLKRQFVDNKKPS